MKEMLITELVENTLKEVKNYGYCENSYNIFKQHYNNLLKYYNSKEIKYYSYETSLLFLKEVWNIDINSGHFNYWQSRKCRSIKILDDVYNGYEIRIKYSYTKIKLSAYENILNSYIDYINKIGYSKLNIKSTNEFLLRFLKYIEDKQINIAELDLEMITKYLETFNCINKITLKNYIFILKMFLKYLYDNNIIKNYIWNLLPVIKKTKNTRLPSIWNFDELNKLLNSIDTNTNKGKRNLAIIMLALTTTLRANDLISLKLNNIDFDNNIIKVVQNKTQNEVVLPLMDKTKNALLDYIENARPTNTIYNNVFLSCRKITKPLNNSSSLSTMIKVYSNALKFKNNQKRGIHSLRHTTLNYLFNDNETSISTITEISGHSNPDSLNAYIKTDIKRLSELTLNIRDFGGEDSE